MPTVGETIRLHAGLRELRDPTMRRRGVIVVAVAYGVLLFLPPAEHRELPNFLPMVVFASLISAVGALQREYRYGGGPKLMFIAAVTSAVIAAGVGATWIAAWFVLGGRLESVKPLAWLFSLPMGRERASRAFEDDVRAERTRRGLPTAP